MTTHTLMLIDVFLPIFLGLITLIGVLCMAHFTESTQDEPNHSGRLSAP